MTYKSLSDSLKTIESDFTNIWKVHCFSGGVVFQAEEKIFLYRKGNIEVIKPATSFHTSFIVNDKLYVRQRGIGLMEWKDNNLVKIQGSGIFDTTGVFLMLPFGRNDKKILIGTQDKGFWIFEQGNLTNPFVQFKIDKLPLIQKSKITGGVLTGDGTFAIATMLNGLIVIDTSGTIRTVINRISGLSDNNVNQVISDQCQNLWLATNNGISTIEISSPLSVYDERSGITESINTLIRYNNLLYAGTSRGLFVQQHNNESETKFVPALNLSGNVWSLLEADGKLLS